MLLHPDKGRSIILGYERTINDALIELASRSGGWFPSRQVLINLLTEISDMRFGDPPGPRPHGFYSMPLYWEVFGRDPVGNTRYRMRLLSHRLAARQLDPERLAESLRHFHNTFAYGCEEGTIDHQRLLDLLTEFEQRAGNDAG
jgi:hypothetical protein